MNRLISFSKSIFIGALALSYFIPTEGRASSGPTFDQYPLTGYQTANWKYSGKNKWFPYRYTIGQEFDGQKIAGMTIKVSKLIARGLGSAYIRGTFDGKSYNIKVESSSNNKETRTLTLMASGPEDAGKVMDMGIDTGDGASTTEWGVVTLILIPKEAFPSPPFIELSIK